MRFSSSFPFASLTLALLSGAAPSSSQHNLHEKRTHLPFGWRQTRRLHATSAIPLRFALRQNDIENIGTYLYDVSHPESPNYGNHWSAGDIARKFAASVESVDAVRSWLVASGISEDRIGVSRTKGWVLVDATAEEAEQLMRTEYNVYTHTSGKEHVACEEYNLPEHVQYHIDFVLPSVNFDAKLTRRSYDDVSAPVSAVGQPGTGIAPLRMSANVSGIIGQLMECDKYITPNCLRALYGIFYEPVFARENSYGIVEYTPQAYLPSDLQLFAEHYSTDLIGKEPILVSIDGGTLQMTDKGFSYNGESDLDLQYGMSLVTGKQNVTLYQVGDLVEGASFNNFLDALDGSYCTFEGGDDPSVDPVYPDPPDGYDHAENCGTVKPAHVISTSYGYNEADLTPRYTARQCAEYAKLGLMGVTVLYSSGDFGVAGGGGFCLNPDGIQTVTGKIFNPTFPSTCPYITSIGATMVEPNATVFQPEVACQEVIYSGGGFSNYFAMPKYQKGAVRDYLRHHRPDYPPTIWNSTGHSRAYPDISANGANYVVAVDGGFGLVYGTSASSPVVGAILTLINDARLAAGKRPIGFINPTIYSEKFSGAFHDITQGSNPGCGTNGFNAARGWDPVTGLGTPDFPKLLERWLSLP